MSTIQRQIPKFFKITQLKSALHLPADKQQTLHRLGLYKRHQTIYQKICPEQAGMIAKVKELVAVELAFESKTKSELKSERKSKSGFTIERRAQQ